MPIYRIRCEICTETREIFRRMSEYDNLPTCDCGGTFARMLCAPAVHTDITPYQSPGTGEWINSRSAQREDLLKSGSFINEPGVKQDIARRKVEVAEKAFAPVADSIDSTVRELVNAGKLES